MNLSWRLTWIEKILDAFALYARIQSVFFSFLSCKLDCSEKCFQSAKSSRRWWMLKVKKKRQIVQQKLSQ